MEELDKERIALMGRFGYKAISMEEALAGDREPRTMWEEINGVHHLLLSKGLLALKQIFHRRYSIWTSSMGIHR